MSAMTSVRRGTVGRNVNTCHATGGFSAAVGPYPRPDCGEAQIPGGWAVQQGRTDGSYGTQHAALAVPVRDRASGKAATRRAVF